MALGWVAERYAYRPLRRAPRLAALITAIGVSIIIQHIAMMVWGRNYLSFPHIIEPNIFQIGGARILLLQVIIILSATAIMAGLLLVVHRTRLGTAMRATEKHRDVSGPLGVNIHTAILFGRALGGERVCK